MAKVLQITKPDKTNHIVPISNKSALLALNNRLKDGQKWLIKEVEEDEVKDLPFIDETYVSAGEALQKNKELSAQLGESQTKLDEEVEKNKLLSSQFAESEKKIAELQALLNGSGNTNPENVTMKAEDKIALIKASETVEEVNDLLTGETRKGVITAGEKKIAELQEK